MPKFRVLKGHDAWAMYAAVIEAKDEAEAVRIASDRSFDGWHETGEVREFDDSQIFDEEVERIEEQK